MEISDRIALLCEIRRSTDIETEYYRPEDAELAWSASEKKKNDIGVTYEITVRNNAERSFSGVIHFKVRCEQSNPKFFMPGYMYNRNTADMPSSGRKAFPRIKPGGERMPESEYFMTRADRLALPVGLIYDDGHVMGVSASPYRNGSLEQEKSAGTSMSRHCGFTCNINDSAAHFCSVGYTLGYENAPWLFVQTATVYEREQISDDNAFVLESGEAYSFELMIYDYYGEDERSVYRAIEDTYWKYHEKPRSIKDMNPDKAAALLSEAISDYAWLENESMYTGFVYDRPEGYTYNKIPSLTWTNGLAVAVPMLLSANKFAADSDVLQSANMFSAEKARAQSIIFINEIVANYYNSSSGFLYESKADGHPSVHGWWYDGMHSGGHSAYLNGQAVYYLLEAYKNEKMQRQLEHKEWLDMAGRVVRRMNEVMNTDCEYPFSMSEQTGAGIEYNSMGGAWCLAASASYEAVTGDRQYLELLLKSERHYYDTFVSKVECYGGPLDTDKAVDSEGILSYIRAVRLLHEITEDDYLLDHMKDALSYEFTFKLGYNTVIDVRPLSEIGWSSCGGSITSTANPHIHPMSSTVIAEMRYYLTKREDEYVRSRMDDTVAWGMQTFNTFDREYGYGRIGWMSERFCFCQGLLTEKYPDGEIASTWFALMPWAAASVIEGFVR